MKRKYTFNDVAEAIENVLFKINIHESLFRKLDRSEEDSGSLDCYDIEIITIIEGKRYVLNSVWGIIGNRQETPWELRDTKGKLMAQSWDGSEWAILQYVESGINYDAETKVDEDIPYLRVMPAVGEIKQFKLWFLDENGNITIEE